MQLLYDDSPTDTNKRNLCVAQQQLENKLDVEESYWKQKANIKWTVEGDRNTKFFHNTVKKRKQKLQIFRMENELGVWSTDNDEIKQNAINTFKEQFNRPHTSEGDALLMEIPTIISQEEKEMLSRFPTIEEIKETIDGMNPNSAPGPDGFNGLFYFIYWDII